jgi:hypothetical protein
MKSSQAVFDEQFLQMRERCLSLAADLDRIQRAGDLPADPRLHLLQQAIGILQTPQADRAKRVLDLFSLT